MIECQKSTSRLFPMLILIGLLCCHRGSEKRETPPATDVATENVKSREIAYDSLTDKQIKEIKRIHHVFAEVNSTSLEAMINNFKSDHNPETGIAMWSKMADAYERFTLNKHIEEHDKKEEAYQLILLRSTITEEEAVDKVDFTYLNDGEVMEILGYYTQAGQNQ